MRININLRNPSQLQLHSKLCCQQNQVKVLGRAIVKHQRLVQLKIIYIFLMFVLHIVLFIPKLSFSLFTGYKFCSIILCYSNSSQGPRKISAPKIHPQNQKMIKCILGKLTLRKFILENSYPVFRPNIWIKDIKADIKKGTCVLSFIYYIIYYYFVFIQRLLFRRL